MVSSSGPGRESVSQSLHVIRLVRNTFPPVPSVGASPVPSWLWRRTSLWSLVPLRAVSELLDARGRTKVGFPPSELRGATGKPTFVRTRRPQPNPGYLWFGFIKRSRTGKCFSVAPRNSLGEKHFPARALGMCQSCTIVVVAKNVFVVPRPSTCRLGASRCKGPDESRLSTKRITWSDWKAYFRPDPSATTKPRLSLVWFHQAVPDGKVFLSRST